MADRNARTGSVMIEVLIALVLLASVGSALVALVGQIARALRTTAMSEAQVTGASRELERLVAWDRSTLIARIGQSVDHRWTLSIAQSTADLFDVAIAESDSGVVLLRTTVYRPDTGHAQP